MTITQHASRWCHQRVCGGVLHCYAAQFAESVAANLSDEDIDDLCTASGAFGNNTVTEMMRMVVNPGYNPDAQALKVHS